MSAKDQWIEGPSDDMQCNLEERLRSAETEIERLKADNYRVRSEWFGANEARITTEADNERLRAALKEIYLFRSNAQGREPWRTAGRALGRPIEVMPEHEHDWALKGGVPQFCRICAVEPETCQT